MGWLRRVFSNLSARKKILVCARLGDAAARPGRARAIWAANTADALITHGFQPLLIGRSDNRPFDCSTSEGLTALRRYTATLYNVSDQLTLCVPNIEKGFHPDNDGSWEFNSRFLRRLIARAAGAHIRDPRLAALCDKLGVPFIYEDHNEDYHLAASADHLSSLKSRHCRGVVAITEAVRERLIALGVPADKVIVENSGFNRRCTLRNAGEIRRRRQSLLQGMYTSAALYAGGLQDERGIDQILDAASLLPDVRFMIAGGTVPDQELRRKQKDDRSLANVDILGYLPQRDVAVLAHSCDVSIYTRRPCDRTAITSPLKIFEYLACGSPMVAYDMPLLRAIVRSGSAVTFFNEATGEGLAAAIIMSLEKFPWLVGGYSASAASAEYFSWERRQERLMKHLFG